MKEIGLSLILAIAISGCTTTQQSNSNTYTQPESQPVSMRYEIEAPQVQVQPPIIQEPQVIYTPPPVEIVEEAQVSYSEPITEQRTSSAQKENVSVQEAFSMIKNGNITLLDVRTQPETISDRKIANSQLIPLQVLGSYIDQLDNSKPILVYCRTGNRSAVAANSLRGQGFNAINVLGGINAWKANGLPVE